MHPRRLALALLVCLPLLAGCGQKGDLYLPPDTDDAPGDNSG